MTTYKSTSSVKPEHVEQIRKLLKNMGSDVPENCINNSNGEAYHSLSYILSLACGSGANQLSLEQIRSIGTEEFQIDPGYQCEGSVTRNI
jgi:hypothetical protein